MLQQRDGLSPSLFQLRPTTFRSHGELLFSLPERDIGRTVSIALAIQRSIGFTSYQLDLIVSAFKLLPKATMITIDNLKLILQDGRAQSLVWEKRKTIDQFTFETLPYKTMFEKTWKG